MDITSYLLGKKAGGGSPTPPKLQEKSVTVTSNGTQDITADSGYDGLDKVELTTNVTPSLQTKNITISSNGTQTVVNDIAYDGLDEVNITTNVTPNNQSKSLTITENTTTTISPDLGYDGLSEVEITTNVSGGGGAEEYFTSSISYVGDSEYSWKNTLYKFPAITLNGTNCRYLFYNSPFVKIDVSNFNTSNVTTFVQMFNNCSKLTEIIGIEDFDLNSLGDSGLSSMFENCSSLTTLNLNGWKNTQKITSNSRLIFNKCSKLQNLYINDWNVSNCTTFQGWFADCKKLTNLDLSNWTNTKSKNHFYMFGGCTSLQTLDVRNLNFSQSENYDYMLDKVPTTCLIIVKDQTEKDWFNTNFSSYTNVKLPSEL